MSCCVTRVGVRLASPRAGMNRKQLQVVSLSVPPKKLIPTNKPRQGRPQPIRERRRGPGRARPSRATPANQPSVTGMSRSDISTVVRMPRAPLFNPRSKFKLLPYYSTGTLFPPVTGLSVSHVFSANGLYDPDITGTGTQPGGFDQMMIFYEHYTVYRARLIVTFRNYTTTTAPIVFLAARGDTPNISDPLTIMEAGNTVSTQLLPGPNQGSMKELKLSINVASFLGFDDLQDSTVARGDISSNPSEGVFFHVGCYNNEVAAAGEVKWQARLEYDAVFTENRVIIPSLNKAFRQLLVATDAESKAAHTAPVQIRGPLLR